MTDLTDNEIDHICAGLKQSAAKVRFLQSLGVRVKRKPNGVPLVNRGHYEAVMGGNVPQHPGIGFGLPVNPENGPVWGVH
ncbi:MAG: DUF4224 domain-containing protein [Rhodoferax sp.]|nr:DUF4224 domain-containing protein [Rhodoferax sp.]